jgi:hypothetical protein
MYSSLEFSVVDRAEPHLPPLLVNSYCPYPSSLPGLLQADRGLASVPVTPDGLRDRPPVFV